MSKAEVIGLGRSGIAAAKLLHEHGWQVTLSDSASPDRIAARANAKSLQKSQQDLEAKGIAVQLGGNLDLDPNHSLDLIVVSPGVPWNIPPLIKARNLGIETIGEIELAWRYLQDIPWIAITGTNGKTTTTALLAAMFETAGIYAPACGNIGYAACELALQKQKPDWVIAEISSYQIESSRAIAPKIGIWTTFSPDHLNRHQTLDRYFQIKASLLHRCKKQIFNYDDAYLRNLKSSEEWQNAYWTSVAGKTENSGLSAYLEDGWVIAEQELVLPVSLFKMVGVHNQQNLLLATAAAKLAGINKEAIAKAIANFPGVAHRLEYICTHKGIDFINDSKATNYDAAKVGLGAIEERVILIAGGQAKQGDDRDWIETILAKAVTVLLIGEAAPTFAKRFQEFNYHAYEIVETLDNAVTRSLELAIKQNAKVVLLSPACASFDRFESFEHRGDTFRQLCLQIE